MVAPKTSERVLVVGSKNYKKEVSHTRGRVVWMLVSTITILLFWKRKSFT